MSSPGYQPYQPQLEPVPWDERIWTVEGPEVRYKLAGIAIPCPTRMTVVKLLGGKLWLHSPVAYSEALAQALGDLGEIAAIVAPNSYHHLNADKWAQVFPAAEVHASPDLLRKLDPSHGWRALGAAPPALWRGYLAQLPVHLGQFTEVVFFHEATRTLIVTDLMQNFEQHRVANRLTGLLLRTGGATGPVGTASIGIRLASIGRRDELRTAVRHMLDWRPASIILSHGQSYRTDAVAELTRAFAWAGGA